MINLTDTEDEGDTLLRNVGDVCLTTLRYNPEVRNLHSHLYETANLTDQYVLILAIQYFTSHCLMSSFFSHCLKVFESKVLRRILEPNTGSNRRRENITY
jgi:hypothetical protein